MLNGQVAVAEGLGSQARYGHFVERLIKEGDRIVGAYARNAETGKYVKANASKGVIVTTGDFYANKDMVRYFRPDMIENGITMQYASMDVEGNFCNTGDGYKLGNWVGAEIQQHQASMQHIMGSGAYLRLNKLGQRFMAEDINNVNEEFQVEIQPDRCYYLIFDSKYGTEAEQQMPGHLMSMFAPNLEALDAAAGDTQAMMTIYRGETIAALMDNIGDIDKNAALAAVARYNEMVAQGFDEDFGKNPRYLSAVNAGPFYAMKVVVSQTLVMMGGLCSDKEAHVLDTNFQVIPGFYVAGNIQGNRFAFKYPFKFGGCSHCIAMFYGYVAGKNIAAGV
jgi:fumarate reductase flavoprotein subunit